MHVQASITLVVIFVVVVGLSGCATWNAEKNAPAIGSFIDVNGARMHVLTAGPRESEKPPVVLIHGASVNLRDMAMSLGEALSSERFVVMVDRPGRGYSERPQHGHELARQAKQINGVVQSLELDRPIMVGQSLGGAVALRYALEYQDEMAGLVLLAPVSHEWPGGVAWYNGASQIPVVGFLLRRLVIPIYGQLAAQGGIEESFAPDIAPAQYYERSGLSLLFRPGDFRSNAADLANLKDEIKKQQVRYGELELPVAIVVGADDETVSPEIHSKTLAGEVEGASLLLLPETGHALHHAETEAIVDVIRALPQRSTLADGSANARAPAP